MKELFNLYKHLKAHYALHIYKSALVCGLINKMLNEWQCKKKRKKKQEKLLISMNERNEFKVKMQQAI